MDKETFIIKGRERLHVPFSRSKDDVTSEVILLRDVLSLIAITMLFSTILIFLPVIIYELIFFSVSNIPMITNQGLIFESIAILLGMIVASAIIVLQMLMRNRAKLRNELILVLVLCCLSILVTNVGSLSAIFTRVKIQLQVTSDTNKINVRLLPSAYKSDISIAIESIISRYYSDAISKETLDNIQYKLQCCGAEGNVNDWIRLTSKIPDSCCGSGVCSSENVYLNNCLDEIARETAKFASLLIGYGFVFVVIVLFTIALYSYFLWAISRDAYQPSSISVIREVSPDFERQSSFESVSSISSSLDEIELREISEQKTVTSSRSDHADEGDEDNMKGQPKFVNNYVL